MRKWFIIFEGSAGLNLFKPMVGMYSITFYAGYIEHAIIELFNATFNDSLRKWFIIFEGSAGLNLFKPMVCMFSVTFCTWYIECVFIKQFNETLLIKIKGFELIIQIYELLLDRISKIMVIED